MERGFFKELTDTRTRQALATELGVRAEEAKEHLNSIWNSFEERRGVNDEFRSSERDGVAYPPGALRRPRALGFIREIAIEQHRGDPERTHGSFMSRVYAFVMNKVLLAVREKLGAAVVVSAVADPRQLPRRLEGERRGPRPRRGGGEPCAGR